MGALNRRAVSSGLERSDLLNPAALDRVVEEAMRRVRLRAMRQYRSEWWEEAGFKVNGMPVLIHYVKGPAMVARAEAKERDR